MRRDAGFTIVEVLIALVLIAVMAAGVAGLVSIAATSSHRARLLSVMTTMAAGKMEELRSLPWPDDVGSAAQDDVDYLDAGGRSLGTGASPPPAAAYVRRWSVRASGLSWWDCLVLTVQVTPVGGGRGGERLVSVRARLAGEG